VVAEIGAREAAAHGGQRDAGCLVKTKSTAEVIYELRSREGPGGEHGYRLFG
jgi:hypothetical protein